MTAVSSSSQSNSDWLRVAQALSDFDLRAHPDTNTFMSFFSDNATFTAPWYNVSKTVAWLGFKVLVEWNTLAFREPPEVTIEDKGDHVRWTFNTVQLRGGRLPTWISRPQWYRIKGDYQLFFEGSGENTKICKFVTIVNEWTPF